MPKRSVLAKLDIPFECTIAGDGNDRQMLEKMVEKFKLCDKVHFTGFVSEPEKLWDKCDVFCFPIRWQEPFGLVALEAMAHGVPVVAFDQGGVREYMEDGRNGFAVPELADMNIAFRLLHKHGDYLLSKQGSYALESVKKKFSEEKFIEKFNELCEVLK